MGESGPRAEEPACRQSGRHRDSEVENGKEENGERRGWGRQQMSLLRKAW